MKEYVERDAAIKIIHRKYGFSEEWARELVLSIPKADVAPTVHGHWSDYYFHPCGNRGKCSVCGKYNIPTNYCPECGTKMDESEDNE